jgi:hypothetical protein
MMPVRLDFARESRETRARGRRDSGETRLRLAIVSLTPGAYKAPVRLAHVQDGTDGSVLRPPSDVPAFCTTAPPSVTLRGWSGAALVPAIVCQSMCQSGPMQSSEGGPTHGCGLRTLDNLGTDYPSGLARLSGYMSASMGEKARASGFCRGPHPADTSESERPRARARTPTPPPRHPSAPQEIRHASNP